MTEPTAEFHIIPNGPLKVTGYFRITDWTGKQLVVPEELFLCRCGGSGNKPYCDDSHKKNGFVG